jgi:hypothetical protein
MTHGMPPRPYKEEYHTATGCICPKLAHIYKSCYNKNPASNAIKSLTTWLQNQCAKASAAKAQKCDNLDCRIRHSFFAPELVQTLLNLDFASGYVIQTNEEPSSIITPWHFIQSISDLAPNSSSRLPPTGLAATQIHDIIGNIVFLFSLLACDFHDYSTLGYGHSAFSRFSPLAGHLILLASHFQECIFVEYSWDTHLDLTKWLALTKAVFIAMADLFQLYETWIDPKFEVHDTFLCAASTGTHTAMTLLMPAYNTSGNRLLPQLEQWRRNLAVFTTQRIRHELPRDGFFDTQTPQCFLPAYASHPVTSPSISTSTVTLSSGLPSVPAFSFWIRALRARTAQQ